MVRDSIQVVAIANQLVHAVIVGLVPVAAVVVPDGISARGNAVQSLVCHNKLLARSTDLCAKKRKMSDFG